MPPALFSHGDAAGCVYDSWTGWFSQSDKAARDRCWEKPTSRINTRLFYKGAIPREIFNFFIHFGSQRGTEVALGMTLQTDEAMDLDLIRMHASLFTQSEVWPSPSGPVPLGRQGLEDQATCVPSRRRTLGLPQTLGGLRPWGESIFFFGE